jgi:hypothetical protein
MRIRLSKRLDYATLASPTSAQISFSACTRCSMSASLWCADGALRNRHGRHLLSAYLILTIFTQFAFVNWRLLAKEVVICKKAPFNAPMKDQTCLRSMQDDAGNLDHFSPFYF